MAKSKSSLEYWRDREEVQRQKNITDEKVYNAEIAKIHNKMYRNIQSQINDFYMQYAEEENITLAEAKKRVSSFDVEAFQEKAAEYVKNRDFSEKANQELRLYNRTMRINRLEMLKANIGLEMCGSYDELEKLFGDKLNDRVIEEFKRQAGILGNTVQNNQRYAHSIVNASFHNATYSDRVWMYHDILRNRLDEILRQALIQGLNPKSITDRVMPLISNEIKKNRRSAAETLLRTELCRVQIDAAARSIKANGYDSYMFIAEPTACDDCRKWDGKVIELKEMEIGYNAPCLHPNCRCSICAAMDEETNIAEGENSKRKYENKNTITDTSINDSSYRKKYKRLGESKKVTREIYNRAVEMLDHRSGTEFEDLSFIRTDKIKSLINKTYNKRLSASPNSKMLEMLNEASDYSIIAIHNHPYSSLPSIYDLYTAYERKYKYGIIACHNGNVYKYKVLDNIDFGRVDNLLVFLEKILYTNDKEKIKQAFINLKEYGVEIEVLS